MRLKQLRWYLEVKNSAFPLFGCLLVAGTQIAQAQEQITTIPPIQDLILEVVMNEHPTGILAAFKREPNGKIQAKPAELQLAGLKPDNRLTNKDGFINLDSLSGVSWRYDEEGQRILFQAVDAARIPKKIEIGQRREKPDFSNLHVSPAFILNYTIHGATGWGASSHKNFSGSFDARFVSSLGVLSTTALGRFNPDFDEKDVLGCDITRLDSAWRYTDPERAITYQLGDGVSGGLGWASSWRFGGVQIRRNFDLRPDLVTAPLPSLAGTTSVPSTLDLYLNNIKVYSGDVPAGPFDFSGLPFMNKGDASIVLRDALGREIRTRHRYFYNANMLGKGILDFSAELGFPRLRYGDSSFDYARDPAGSFSLRYGLSNQLTLEGHVEAIRGLWNGGIGLATSLGSLGAVSAAFAGSHYRQYGEVENGGRLSLDYSTAYKNVSFYANYSQSFGQYNTIGLVVDREQGDKAPLSARANSVLSVGVAFPLVFDPSYLNINYSRVRGETQADNASLLNLGWSRTIFDRISLYVSGYADLKKHHNFGVFAGVSIPMGKSNMNASVNASKDNIDTVLSKSAYWGDAPLSWTLRDRESFNGQSSRSAGINYRSRVGSLSASVDQAGGEGRVTATMDGALIIAGGGIFFVNRVSDAFAIVKGGGADMPVLLNGRQVATTNQSGHAFVPDLQSYQNNTLTIDPTNLAADLQPEETQVIVMPAYSSGVTVDFGTYKINGATVIVHDAAGNALPLGSEVIQDDSQKTSVMGYDGRVWLTNLSSQNSLTITMPDGLGSCHANFSYQEKSGGLPEIDGVTCL